MSLIHKKKSSQMGPSRRMPMMSELDRFFDEAFDRMGLSDYSEGEMMSWQPRIDVSETDKEYKVKAELPGLDEKDVEIVLQDNTLSIKGEKKFQQEDNDEDYHRLETSYGCFHRTIPFSRAIDDDKIEAEYKNGILNVKLGKSDEIVSNTHKIKIKKH